MSGPHTITRRHLDRLAIVYVRQSTFIQVRDHTESTRRQYAQSQDAARLGWPVSQIVTIDADLGLSGRSTAGRAGFKELVSRVCVGEVGAIFGLEISRLARSSADLQRLLEFCSLTETLIVDADGIYDLQNFNDRLLLGLKRPDSYSTSYSSSRGRISLLRDPPRITQLCVGKRRLNGREVPNVGTRDRWRRMRPLDEWRSISDTFRRPPWHSPEGGPCLGPSRRGGRCTRQFAT